AGDAGQAAEGDTKPRSATGGLAGSAARKCTADCRHQSGLARGGAGGTVPGRPVLPPELHSNSRTFADGAARGYSVAGAILCKKIQPGLWKEYFRINATGANGAAATSLARQCPGA